jgi:hypothetical protein
MHDAFTIGVPVLAIFLGILLNQRGVDKLENRMEKMNSDLSSRIDKSNSDLTGRIDRIQADLSRFYQILGEHTGKIEMLTKKS